MPESSAWQDICRWEFCPEHEDDDDDDDIDIDQARTMGFGFQGGAETIIKQGY